MTTAPTPSDVERLARGLEEGFAGYAAWLQPAAAELRRLQDENKRLRSAERTLQRLGYQDRGGQEWAPPIGKAPDFDLIDSLRSRIAELEARKPLPLSDDERLRLRSDVARAIWDVMREHEDRCDHALEDVEPRHQVWDCADAAIRAVHGITGGSS